VLESLVQSSYFPFLVLTKTGACKFIIELNLLATAYRRSAGNVQHSTPLTTRFSMTRRAVSLLAMSTSHFNVTRRAAHLLAMSIYCFDVTRRAVGLLAMPISHLSVTRRAVSLLAMSIIHFNMTKRATPSLPWHLRGSTRDAILTSYSHQYDKGETPCCVIFILSNAMREFPSWCVRYLVIFYVFSSKIIQK